MILVRYRYTNEDIAVFLQPITKRTKWFLTPPPPPPSNLLYRDNKQWCGTISIYFFQITLFRCKLCRADDYFENVNVYLNRNSIELQHCYTFQYCNLLKFYNFWKQCYYNIISTSWSYHTFKIVVKQFWFRVVAFDPSYPRPIFFVNNFSRLMSALSPWKNWLLDVNFFYF